MEAFKKYEKKELQDMLDNNANLRRWFLNYAKGSTVVADTYLRRLGYFLTQCNLTAADYVKLPKRKMEEMAFDYIQEMETRINPKTGKRYAPSYVESNLKSIASWAKSDTKTFEMKIKIANASARPTLENERVPTQDELRKVLYADTTPQRTRVSIAITAFSGCRLEVQGGYMGVDGLRLKDFPELEIKDGAVTFKHTPTLIIVRAELSKSRHWYPTFMLDEGCEILAQWLGKRIAEGEVLTPQSGVIVSTERMQKAARRMGISDTSPFIRTIKIGDFIRQAMRASGLPWRPYVFRSYFDTMQMYAEGKGLISHTYSQVFMGHSGDIESVYTLRKAELPPEVLEDMREAYQRCQPFMSTDKQPATESVKDELKKQLLLVAGFKQDDIDKLDLAGATDEEFQKMVRERLGAMTNNGNRQKVVPVDQVRELLPQGWEHVAQLPTGEAIVKLPL